MREFIVLAILIKAVTFLGACASMPGMPGHISESVSKFDNSRQISLEPAWACTGFDCVIKLGLYKNTKMSENEVVMIAIVKGAHTLASGESLHFNLDGEFFSFASIDSLTDIETTPGHASSVAYIPPSNWSSKRYLVDMNFIERLVNARMAIVKIDLTRGYVEGVFSTDTPTNARPAFREFCKRVAVWE